MKYITTEIMGRPFRGYIPDGTERAYYKGKRPAVIIFPGGGYYFTYEGEGEPITPPSRVLKGLPSFPFTVPKHKWVSFVVLGISSAF